MGLKFSDKNTPRWIIFTIDMAICFSSFVLAYLLRFNFSIPGHEIEHWIIALPTLIITRSGSFLTVRTYQGIIRYTSSRDAYRIFFTILTGSGIIVSGNLIAFNIAGMYLVPFSVIIIDFFVSSFSLIAFRLLVKSVYLESRNPRSEKKAVVIYGAGESGVLTKRAIDQDA
ncbi:MAG: nucleoside-diphosphate sugar epimerase/dehydratase, partial [Bacteroidota bacterium]